MILVIDNYDSFTFNLVQALQAAGAQVRVVRNDAVDAAGIRALADDPDSDLRGIVISPGPGDPDHAGISVDSVRVAAERGIPLLGVCLGMQSMAAAFGASIVRAPTLVHGEASEVTHDGAGLLAATSPCLSREFSSTPSPCSRRKDHGCWRTSCARPGRARPPGSMTHLAHSRPPAWRNATKRRLIPRHRRSSLDERAGAGRARHDRRRRHALHGRGARGHGARPYAPLFHQSNGAT